MPGKRPSVKNEKQYEKLKEKGMSKELAAHPLELEAGRHDRPEEGRRPQGRQGDRAQAQLAKEGLQPQVELPLVPGALESVHRVRRELVFFDPPAAANVDRGVDDRTRIHLDRHGDGVLAARVEEMLER